MKYIISHPEDGIKVNIDTDNYFEFYCSDGVGNGVEIILC